MDMPLNSVGMKGKAVFTVPHARSEAPRNIKTNNVRGVSSPDYFSFRNWTHRIKNPTHSAPLPNQGEQPFVLLALLLLALPALFTLQKFVVLLFRGEPSHQLLAVYRNSPFFSALFPSCFIDFFVYAVG
jgi:hypothetical protein